MVIRLAARTERTFSVQQELQPDVLALYPRNQSLPSSIRVAVYC